MKPPQAALRTRLQGAPGRASTQPAAEASCDQPWLARSVTARKRQTITGQSPVRDGVVLISAIARLRAATGSQHGGCNGPGRQKIAPPNLGHYGSGSPESRTAESWPGQAWVSSVHGSVAAATKRPRRGWGIAQQFNSSIDPPGAPCPSCGSSSRRLTDPPGHWQFMGMTISASRDGQAPPGTADEQQRSAANQPATSTATPRTNAPQTLAPTCNRPARTNLVERHLATPDAGGAASRISDAEQAFQW